MEALTPFKDQQFTLITCLDVLEHVTQPERALAEVQRVLKPGGLAVFTVPADPRLWSDRDLRLQHRKRYTPADLRAELRAAGFEVLNATHTNLFYYWPFRLWLLWLRCTQVQAVPHVSQDTFETNSFFSGLWRWMLRMEMEWWLRLPLPWGVSAVAVVRKPR
jgi:SAM-dependent methyltransferase